MEPEFTPEQYREAAQRALAAGNMAAAEELAQAGIAAQSRVAAPADVGAPASVMSDEEYGQALLGNTIPAEIPRDNVAAPQTAEPSLGRSLTLGLQGTGRGLADVAGLPADLSTAGANLALTGVDALSDFIFAENSPEFLDYRFPQSMLGADAIADGTASVAEAAGMDLIAREDMSPSERMAYEANRFGAGAAVTGGSVAAAGSARRAGQLSSGQTRVTGDIGDRLARPYVNAPGRTVVADTTGGAGAGAALSYSQENPIAPDNPILQGAVDLGAMLAGGVAGNVAGAGALAAPGALRRGGENVFGVGSYTDPTTGEVVPRRIMDAAGASLQINAINPAAARQGLAATRDAAVRSGVPEPTPGAATGDIGLRAVEASQRQVGSPVDPTIQPRFEARDQAVFEAVDTGVRGLRPEDADIMEALDIVQQRPAQLSQQRADAALPILERAYANGARVDVAPVVARIDEMNSVVRRPEVRNVLERVRTLLTDPATGELGGDARGIHEARKGINDMIEGRVTSDGATPRYAAQELIELRNLLDNAISGTPEAPGPVPEFRDFLNTFREQSRPLDVFNERGIQRMVENETDLRNTARSIFSGNRYGTEAEMRQVLQAVGDDPRAVSGWRAAVSEVLADRITQTRDGTVNYRQLRQIYDRHRPALSEIYSPQEIERLDGFHTVLSRIDAARTQARHPGVDNPNYTGVIEAGLLASGYDAITVGMIMRRARVAANLLGLERLTPNYQVARVLERAAFDYDLYEMLLERPVTEGAGQRWSADVRNHLLYGEGARRIAGAGEEEEDPSLEDMVMED